MVLVRLLLAGLVSAAIGSVYFYVGRRITERPVHEEVRPAVIHFGMWWMALAGSTALSGVQEILAGFGITSVPVFGMLGYVNLFLISIALTGLVYYFTYIFTGRVGALPWILGFYFAFFLLLAFTISRANPSGVEVGAWSVSLVYETPLEGPLEQFLRFLLLVPPIVGALAYMSLFFRVDGFDQRYRIGLVSSSFLLWFGGVYGASLTGLNQAVWWPVASNALGLLAALAVWIAYLPPGWLRDRLGVAPVGAGSGRDVRPEQV